LLALCTTLGLALVPAAPAAAAAAAGGGNSFNELVGAHAHETTPTTTGTHAHKTTPTTTGTHAHETTPTNTRKTNTTPTETASRSNSKTVIFLVFGVGIALLIGIGFAIMRDARRFAPVGDGPVSDGRSGRDPAARLRKRRAQSKAARQQRKRNR
jgi:hypothetical protein